MEIAHAFADSSDFYANPEGGWYAGINNNVIGAHHLKSDATYKGEDAEVWVFNCGSATELI